MLTPREGPNATKTGRRWFLNLPSLSYDFTQALRDRSEDKVMLASRHPWRGGNHPPSHAGVAQVDPAAVPASRGLGARQQE
jgi:hypothetical protein